MRLISARNQAFDASTWEERNAQDDTSLRSIAAVSDIADFLLDHLNGVRRAASGNTVVYTSNRLPRQFQAIY